MKILTGISGALLRIMTAVAVAGCATNHGSSSSLLKEGPQRVSTSGRSVATDASSNVYVAGDTDGNLDGNTLTGTYDFFITKYDSSGNKLFTRQLGAAGKIDSAISPPPN